MIFLQTFFVPLRQQVTWCIYTFETYKGVPPIVVRNHRLTWLTYAVNRLPVHHSSTLCHCSIEVIRILECGHTNVNAISYCGRTDGNTIGYQCGRTDGNTIGYYGRVGGNTIGYCVRTGGNTIRYGNQHTVHFTAQRLHSLRCRMTWWLRWMKTVLPILSY